jgi:hypothetical protein
MARLRLAARRTGFAASQLKEMVKPSAFAIVLHRQNAVARIYPACAVRAG